MIDREYIYTLYCAGAGAILKYLEQLDSRIELAQSLVETSQKAKIDLLEEETATTKHIVENQRQELLELHQINNQLIKRIHELERELTREPGQDVQRDSHNSSLPPSTDLPWQKVKRTRSLRKKSTRKVGGQVGHQAKTLLQVKHPDQVIVHALKACPNCDALLDSHSVVRCQRRQVFDIANGRTIVTEHQAKCNGQEKQERKLSFTPPFLIFNCFSNSIGLT